MAAWSRSAPRRRSSPTRAIHEQRHMSPGSSADPESTGSGSPDAATLAASGSPEDHVASASNQSRTHFQQQLQELEAHALGGLNLIVEQLDRVLEALGHQDVELAQMVIADDDRVDGRYLEVHQGILSLLALQAPVAGDLRLVAALLHIMKNIERMGDQCVNMAKLVPLAGHEPPADERILTDIQQMGEQARAQVIQCKQA